MRDDRIEPNGEEPSPATQPAKLDANGYNPADYKWVPVLRRPRADGWTPERQVRFIAALADGATVAEAAREVGMSENSAYRLRRSPGGENFARAWLAARAHSVPRVLDGMFEQAIHGSEEPVFDRNGCVIFQRRRYNHRAAQFLLRAYMPERFRHAHKSVRCADEELPPEVEPLDEAIRRLEPVPPEQPHLLMSPDELEDALFVADELGGRLPPWYGGEREQAPPVEPPLGEEFERQLAAAKRAASGCGDAADD